MIETLNKKLSFTGDLHKKILREVDERKKYSERKMGDHYRRWEKADSDMKGYLPTTEADTYRKAQRETAGKLDYVTLDVPYNFAVIASMHTYITSVFLSRSPIYQFSGRHGESQDSVIALEAVMDYQTKVGEQIPYLYSWVWDACKYGVGIIGEYWEEEIRVVSSIQEREVTFFSIGTGKTKKVRVVEEIPGYQGNKLYNIRPKDFFPDPRVNLSDFQRGEFAGRQTSVGMSYLVDGQRSGRYFNIDVLLETGGNREKLDAISSSTYYESPTGLGEYSFVSDAPFGSGGADGSAPGRPFITLLEMAIKINPSQWGLGSSDKTEIWVFSVANERVVIGAKPLGLYHNRFPYSVMETGFGSEDFIKTNTIDSTRPLAQTLTWLFNTHMYNVRKAINTVRVVDPSKVVMKDVEKPQPGGIIRLKSHFYGGDVRSAITQLETSNVTQNHLRDSQVVEQLIQRVGGVTDNVMGLMSEGGRKTATEVRSANGFAVTRLKTLAEFMSATGMTTLAARMVSNTQQLMSMERKFAVAGNTLAGAQKFMDVSPEAIAGFYDFVAVDGTLPIDRLAQANFWKELITQLSRSPQLMMQWDLGEMVAHTMALQGERNVNRFKVNVLPPGQGPAAGATPVGGVNGQGLPGASRGAPQLTAVG